jgi:hypothetical protein
MSNDAIPLKGPHARRRFTSHLQKVESLLSEAQGLAADGIPGEIIFKGGLRTSMFMLEALGRVYRHQDLDNDLFERIRMESKIVEDAMGLVDYWAAVSNKAAIWLLPAGAQQLAKARYLEACGRVWAWVESQNWITSRYHPDIELLGDRFTRKLKNVDWLTPKRESKSLRKWLVNELHDIHEHMEELDLQDIEHGLHEARREVRWISIYFTAVAGGFILDTAAPPPENWSRYLSKEIVGNPYNQLPAPEEDDQPLKVPAPLLYALSYLIEELGKIKDKAQWTETAHHLLHLTGEKANLQELLHDDYLEAEVATSRGSELLQQVLIEDQLLLRLASGIER